VANASRRWSRHILEGFAKQWDLELANAVHAVKQAKEVYLDLSPTERFFEVLHVLELLPVLLPPRVVSPNGLKISESSPGEMHHVFVTFREQPDFVDHLR